MSELYQFRALMEVVGVRLACEQATEQEVADIAHFLDKTGPEDGGRSSVELVALERMFPPEDHGTKPQYRDVQNARKH
ncbi:FCD domain-containing protein [Candidatus Spongiihabitans sp.]|uniref:FCD domain-containing protein n=1 Tax=Candidatus Spongiihabitans sp. TaxID=3101308 RepID=UPI003C70142B